MLGSGHKGSTLLNVLDLGVKTVMGAIMFETPIVFPTDCSFVALKAAGVNLPNCFVRDPNQIRGENIKEDASMITDSKIKG